MLSKSVGADDAELQKSIGRGQQMKIVVSNCGVNSGDAGGPLLNDKAEVVGVTFAAPTDTDTATALGHLASHAEKRREAFEDIIWALINSKEFQFND